MNQVEKATYFKSLHMKGDPLVLYNVWDAGGAKTLAEMGAKASATGSWSMAAAHGFDDGEAIPLQFVLQIIDFEGGYAVKPEVITENVRKVIKAGAIGINFEDQVVQGEGLYPISKQVERIKAVRKAAELENIPLFINARTDLFLASNKSEHEILLSEAIELEAAYAEAGADGFFVPGLTQLPLIKQIVDSVNLPVNVMMMGDLNSISDAINTGVSRISYGPGPYFNAVTDLVERYKTL
jgi:2-methylisocitrate lyase-like PEP mutase family enzyme